MKKKGYVIQEDTNGVAGKHECVGYRPFAKKWRAKNLFNFIITE